MSHKSRFKKFFTFEFAGIATYVVIYAVLIFCQQKLAPVSGASSVILGITMQLQSLLSAFTVVSMPDYGYPAAVAMNCVSVFILTINIFVFDRNNAITGLISTIAALIMISIIHFFYKKILISNRSLIQTNKRLKEKDDKLTYMAYFDILTGLPNRQIFIEKTNKYINTTPVRPFTVISANIDNFKSINDQYGSNAGDAVLCSYSKKLQNLCNNSLFIAKTSADEFGIIIEGKESEDNIINYIEAIREIFSRPVKFTSFEIIASISFGIASYPADASSSVELLKCVNSAMCYSKSHGKNTACFYSRLKSSK